MWFRKRPRHDNREKTEESLERAEAARADQAAKHAAEQPVTEKLDRLIAANNLADLIRESLRNPPPRRAR